MRVARWGNSLAVRLPRDLAEELSLKEGDEIVLRPAGEKAFEVVREMEREEAITRIRAMSWPLPDDYEFSRDDIYDRSEPDSPGQQTVRE